MVSSSTRSDESLDLEVSDLVVLLGERGEFVEMGCEEGEGSDLFDDVPVSQKMKRNRKLARILGVGGEEKGESSRSDGERKAKIRRNTYSLIAQASPKPS